MLEDIPAAAAHAGANGGSDKGGDTSGDSKVQRMLADLGPTPAGAGADEYSLVTTDGVTVADATFRAAVRFARVHDADAVELVPGDMPVAALLQLLRMFDPAKYADDRMQQGISAGHATLVRTGLLRELGVDATTGLDPVEHIELTSQLKWYAPTTCHIVLAPGLTARATDPSWIVPRYEKLHRGAASWAISVPALASATMALAPVVGRRRGLPAYVAHVLLPVVVTAGSSARPSDLRPLPLLTRAGRDLARSIRSVTAKRPTAATAQADENARSMADKRGQYAARVEDMSGFLEPRRETCPWCESPDLQGILDVPDLVQRKPGEFHLDRCQACHHVFQNPRLSLEGLDFYYSDAYDGLGAEGVAALFAGMGDMYRTRAAMLTGVTEPKRWLDVGTGHGHFCLAAREIWPETRFDGLDMGASIVEAGRRGWVDHAYQGLFPELAPDLTGSYDVVSMHHYLEHTRDPRAEIEAAATALESGGHLLIEVPDPDSRVGPLLGKYWVPWLQPQHQHFVQFDNLCTELESRGFTIVASHRAESHIPVDLVGAVGMALQHRVILNPAPWLPEPSRSETVARFALSISSLPVFAAAALADRALELVGRRVPGLSNAYRVLARKD